MNDAPFDKKNPLGQVLYQSLDQAVPETDPSLALVETNRLESTSDWGQAIGRPPRRRKRKRYEPDTSVPSPCVAICIIDKPDRLCRGCKRSIDEIRDWMIMDADAKRAVLEDIKNR